MCSIAGKAQSAWRPSRARSILKLMDMKERYKTITRKFATTSRVVVVASVLVWVSACGNKGPLYLEADEETLLEIDELQREIDEAEEEARKAREKAETGSTGTTE